MSANKDAASDYARAGFPVLRTYGLLPDPTTGILTCTCFHHGTGEGVPGCKPGKHAYFDSKGANDATTDPDVIASWDETDNIGIAGRDTYPIVDIDDPEIVEQLLHPDVCLADLACVSTTGRGLHLYVQCAPTKSGVPKLKRNGERIGEIRALGQYVVAPPSLHHTGRQYGWMGGSILDGIPVWQGDGWDYLANVLSWINVEILPKRESGPYVPLEDAIALVPELPFETANGMLLSMLGPGYLIGEDRSGELFKLACELLRESRAQNLDIPDLVIAGILKYADIDRGTRHFKGAKYAHRANGDAYLWSIVQDAKASVVREEDAPLATVPPIIPDDDVTGPTADQARQGSYYFVEKPPQFVDNTNPRRPKRLATFEPKILEHLNLWEGEIEPDPKATYKWRVQVRQGEKTKTFLLDSNEYETSSDFTKALSKLSPPHFIIEHDATAKLRAAVQHFSGETPERKAYAFSGWVPDMDAFILPGAPGLITADGIDIETRWEPPKGTSNKFPQYGWGVVPSDYDLASLLRMLYTVRDPVIVVPVLTQVFSATMVSLGSGSDPVFLHLFGGTGSFKSTLARLALSILGRFMSFQTDRVDEWHGTANSLQGLMHETRDLPMIIDDYKVSKFSDAEQRSIITMIQNYADRQARSRMTTDQRQQKLLYPRGLAISTGEDVWEGQESVDARTLIVDMATSPDERDPLMARSSAIIELAKQGVVGSVGYAWLTWLARQGREWITETLTETHKRRLASKAYGDLHQRKVSSLAMLLSVSSIVREFIREAAPDFLAEYTDIERMGWLQTIAAEQERSLLSRGASPLETIIDAMIAVLSVGEGYLQPRLADGVGVGLQGSTVIGYIDQDYVWLNDEITLGWYKAKRRREGDSKTPASWKTLKQEALKNFDGKYPSSALSIYGHGLDVKERRLLGIPRARFFDGAPASIQEQIGSFQ